MVTSFFKYVVSGTECVWLMYIWIKLRWTEWYRVWSNIGNVKLHSNCQMASHHAPRFHLQHCKHNFAATDDSSGGRNGLRKVRVVLSSPTQHSPRRVHRWTQGNTTSQGSWISLACNMVIFIREMRGDHCKPNPEVWSGTRLSKQFKLWQLRHLSHYIHIIISASHYRRHTEKFISSWLYCLLDLAT